MPQRDGQGIVSCHFVLSCKQKPARAGGEVLEEERRSDPIRSDDAYACERSMHKCLPRGRVGRISTSMHAMIHLHPSFSRPFACSAPGRTAAQVKAKRHTRRSKVRAMSRTRPESQMHRPPNVYCVHKRTAPSPKVNFVAYIANLAIIIHMEQ